MTRRPSVLGVVTPLSTPCRLADGWRLTSGYHQVRREGRRWLAHRWAWTEQRGPIPSGLLVLHRCDNRACTAIDHLFLGTYADNAADCAQKGRQGGPHFGEDNHGSRLTAAQVERIRREAPNGRWGVQAKLAREFDVSPVTIHDVVHGKTW